MSKMTDEQKKKMAQEITLKTVEDVFEIIDKATSKMKDEEIHPSMAFHLIKAVGFAVSGSSLAFFAGDEAKKSAAVELVEDFKENVNRGLELNLGLGNTPKSSIILQ